MHGIASVILEQDAVLRQYPKKQLRRYVMRSVADIWGSLGDLDDGQTMQVLCKLFTVYESDLQRNPDNQEALEFFKKLDQMLTQVCECNSNRR